jgi:hypothetical protein
MKINTIHRLSNTGKMLRNPLYHSAHDNDFNAALTLVDQLIPDYSIFGKLSGIICPVQKLSGNKIPLALAHRIIQHSDAKLCDSVFLTNNRPGTRMIDRMFYEPDYSGFVEKGNYILVDDVFTTGITLKGLKTFIETRGGNVISAYTLGSSKSLLFETSKLKQRILKLKHTNIDKYFDSSNLTDSQINYLLRFNSLSNLDHLYISIQHEKLYGAPDAKINLQGSSAIYV